MVIFLLNLHAAVEFSLLVHDVLLDQLALLLAQIQTYHFVLEHIPRFLPLLLVVLQLGVPRLNIRLRVFSTLLLLLTDLSANLRCASRGILIIISDAFIRFCFFMLLSRRGSCLVLIPALRLCVLFCVLNSFSWLLSL